MGHPVLHQEVAVRLYGKCSLLNVRTYTKYTAVIAPTDCENVQTVHSHWSIASVDCENVQKVHNCQSTCGQ